MTSGKKFWSDQTPVAGQQFEYNFDTVGNRNWTKADGDTGGANLRQGFYTNNLLNQITGRTVPGYLNVLGTATNTATVAVNDQPVVRQGDYWWKELSVNNSTGAVWQAVDVEAVIKSGNTNNPDLMQTNYGHSFLPKTPEGFAYDADGNLTGDSLWTNTWNAENRLTSTESAAGVAASARAREQWTHLPDGRWIERVVSAWNGSSYVPQTTNRFVWDGVVLVAVLDHTNGLLMSFLSGVDLSGSLQGAGGVGGVLAVATPSSGSHFYAYDGNANVAALANADDGTPSAVYTYDPFGNTLRVTGPMASANPIRFSTQYRDDVTGDLKYLFREYRPSIGRWLSRDPVEQDMQGLYAFALNAPSVFVDVLGQYVFLGTKCASINNIYNYRLCGWIT